MTTTITSLVRAATASNLLIDCTPKTKVLVDSLLDCLGNSCTCATTDFNVQAILSLRTIVHTLRTLSVQQHPVLCPGLCRLLPLLTALKQVRESVAHCWRVTNARLDSPGHPAPSPPSPPPLPTAVPSTLSLHELYRCSVAHNAAATAWSHIKTRSATLQLEIIDLQEDERQNTLDSTHSFQHFVLLIIQKERSGIETEYRQMQNILKTMHAILQTGRACSADPVLLQHALANADTCTDPFKELRYPLWTAVLTAGLQRLKEVVDLLKMLRTNVQGVVDVATIHHAIETAAQQQVGGDDVEQWKRVANELNLASRATGGLLALWTRRRNIGVGREMTSVVETKEARMRLQQQQQQQQRVVFRRRPVDTLLERLSCGARLRDFVGLSNHTNTLYVCDAMLRSPGFSIDRGLEASMAFARRDL